MTIAVQENGLTHNVQSVCAQQRRLLKRLEPLLHYLGGSICAGLWLPGLGNTFDNPVRKVTGRRPVFLTLEATDTALNFTGSISRLKNDKLVFSPIFAYDVSMPYTPRGGGRVLPANNVIIARRANELLNALVSFAREVAFGAHTELQPAVFPEVICDANGTIYEDYTPVLGLAIPNPAKHMKSVTLQRYSPAAKILARHGVVNKAHATPQQIEQVLAEFRAEFPEFNIDVHDVLKAIADPDATFFTFTIPFGDALSSDPQSAVDALRSALPHKYKAEAGYHDLLQAAKNPEQPVKISRFSALQIFPVETVQDLPESYAGTVLAPVNWAPAAQTFEPPTI